MDVTGKRRERKRATDREAQREHRKRQKQYVQELEAKIEFMKGSSCSDQVTTLLKENEELREQLKSLRCFFGNVRDLVNVHESAPDQKKSTKPTVELQHAPGQNSLLLHSDGTSPTVSSDHQAIIQGLCDSSFEDNTGSNVEPEDPTAWESIVFATANTTAGGPRHELAPDPSHSADDAETDKLDALGFSTSLQPDPLHENLDWMAQLANHSPLGAASGGGGEDLCTSHGIPNTWHTASYPDTNFFDQNSNGSRRPWLLHWAPSAVVDTFDRNGDFSSVLSGMSSYPVQVGKPYGRPTLDLTSTGLEGNKISQDEFASALRPGCPNRFPSKPPWLCFPLLMSPALPTDAPIQNFLKQHTRSQNQRTSTRLRRPTMLSFLLNSPSDPLSQAVTQYLSPIRSFMGLPEMFACYWLISLLLRWHINQDEESFNDIPSWLRPTLLQTRITHPLCVWFMPWPFIRDKLLISTFTNIHLAQEVMLGFGPQMKVDLSLSQVLHAAVAAEADASSSSGIGNVVPLDRSPDDQSSTSHASKEESMGNHSELIHDALSDLSNWRLNDRFFVQFPEYREPYHQSRQAFDRFSEANSNPSDHSWMQLERNRLN